MNKLSEKIVAIVLAAFMLVNINAQVFAQYNPKCGNIRTIPRIQSNSEVVRGMALSYDELKNVLNNGLEVSKTQFHKTNPTFKEAGISLHSQAEVALSYAGYGKNSFQVLVYLEQHKINNLKYPSWVREFKKSTDIEYATATDIKPSAFKDVYISVLSDNNESKWLKAFLNDNGEIAFLEINAPENKVGVNPKTTSNESTQAKTLSDRIKAIAENGRLLVKTSSESAGIIDLITAEAAKMQKELKSVCKTNTKLSVKSFFSEKARTQKAELEEKIKTLKTELKAGQAEFAKLLKEKPALAEFVEKSRPSILKKSWIKGAGTASVFVLLGAGALIAQSAQGQGQGLKIRSQLDNMMAAEPALACKIAASQPAAQELLADIATHSEYKEDLSDSLELCELIFSSVLNDVATLKTYEAEVMKEQLLSNINADALKRNAQDAVLQNNMNKAGVSSHWRK